MAAFQYRTRNFRDIGGVRGTYGTIRPGLLYRSAKLDDLTAEEVAMLRPFGLTLALDLRDAGEKAPPEQQIGAFLPGMRVEAVPLMDNLPQEVYAEIMERVKHIHTRPALRLLMAEQYSWIMTRSRSRVMQALTHVMSHEGPLVFFCVAGKDRTGILAMLLGRILGLDARARLRDYHRTNDYYFGQTFWRRPSERARRQYAKSTLPLWMIDTLSEAHRVYLDAAEAQVAEAGGVDAWLSGPDGPDPVLVADFRTRMLMP